jgi:hypothetical protein
MHDAMIMHKRKRTNKSSMGIFLGRYREEEGGGRLSACLSD